MYVCSCFGITEAQVKKHADAGACTPRQIASACKAGTDCGGCVRRIQALLGRDCSRRDLVGQQREPVAAAAVDQPMAMPVAAVVPVAATPDVRLPDAA
ncbi:MULTISPECIES: (2Fe-2S)-binding protein [Streptomyces]|uniref:Bacterioferritin-associated ferredoxin n=1 Tax=Streptomyces rhizosphaericola TaxID=2564098 RepID=A0ABY2PHA8_9ACTN|nr:MULTISPECIES: (2Fe-2S)-binding protein [Streptomyces]ARI54972.1 (2Fe-2S)-binding protein [Streptomyces sp. S8]MYU00834.1 (2Fe-2S)-binding protein [Streptomyces sp. SID8350]NGO87124.1 (2Fe-2S)-binding protein [Streptomyces sp. 196(2019)]TGZ10337.1 (2Fe-2S)-binding protein [Streptomyces rhizosphaericola]SCK10980.1 Bacterioferritin-associated ferredoxin [Streptomyces sp. AmelKG-D3]